RRTWRKAVGRPAAAHRDRPRDAQGRADPDPRRGDIGARLGGRGRDPGKSLSPDGGQDGDRHRPPAFHHRGHGQAGGDGQGSHPRGGNARRTDCQGGALRPVMAEAVGRIPAARRTGRRAGEGNRGRMSQVDERKDDGFAERIWRRAEGVIEPFADTEREVLPRDAWQFILFFARQAKGPFVLLLIVGGLSGAVDAALYWSLGWLIDLLETSSPARLLADHWWEIVAFLLLVLVVRAAVMVANAIVEQQVIVPSSYQLGRCQS